MSLAVLVFRLPQVKLSVNLGGGQARVAEEFLYRPEVRAALQQMHRVGVAQGVRRDSPPQTRPPSPLTHNAIGGLPGKCPAPIIEPKSREGLACELRTGLADVGFEPGPGFRGYRDDAGFASLARNAQGLVPGEYGVGTETDRLRNPQPRSVKQLQKCSVAEIAGGIQVRVLQELGEFGGGQRFGQVAQGPAKAEVRPIPLRPPPGADHPPIETTQGRQAAQAGAGGHIRQLRMVGHHIGRDHLGECRMPLPTEPLRGQVKVVLVRG